MFLREGFEGKLETKEPLRLFLDLKVNFLLRVAIFSSSFSHYGSGDYFLSLDGYFRNSNLFSSLKLSKPSQSGSCGSIIARKLL